MSSPNPAMFVPAPARTKKAAIFRRCRRSIYAIRVACTLVVASGRAPWPESLGLMSTQGTQLVCIRLGPNSKTSFVKKVQEKSRVHVGSREICNLSSSLLSFQCCCECSSSFSYSHSAPRPRMPGRRPRRKSRMRRRAKAKVTVR